ncbi:nuclear pore complex protein DDB_G0274915 [Anopheles cruzii]|uniref:nuclear pore complex protein DDB_G0274915 n=1 Tax=Anopheles cruzii TaxID=68878 RepID=UPI0022EC66CC|nr:nuclear pore complex protein DDB_G0274915 [Anopheles cruzii]
MMADTPTNTGQQASATTDPTVIPQWKKELIQRRKNLAKTIGAVATQVHDSASTVAAAISAASSPVLAHPRTPTGAFPVGSPFYAGVATKATSPTSTGFIATTVGVHSPNEHTGGGLVVGSHGSVAANGVQSNSNAGAEHNGGSSSSVAAAATTASRPVSAEQQQSPQPIGSSSSKPPFLVSGSAALSNGQQQQQQQQGLLRDGVAARKMVAATATEEIIVYEKSVISEVDGEELGGGGGGSVGQFGLGDEELKYGPGIVSRLRCRYLSLALRQSVTKQRPSLNSMRRATSLNNLLDEESEDLSEREQSIGSEGCGGPGGAHGGQQQQQQKKYHTQSYHHTQHQQQQHLYANGNNHHNHLIHNQPPHHPQQQQQPLGPTVVLQPAAAAAAGGYQKKQPWHYNQPASEEQQAAATAVVVSKAAAPFLRGVQNSYTRASRQVEKKNDYNRYTKHHRGGSGGADSVLLKRARSVEALVRYDHKAWERDVTGTTRTSTAATAATAAAAATPATTTPIVPSSVVETDSNVIILDEIAPTTTTTAAATPNGGSIPAEHHHHHHHGSNGISSSAAAPIIGTSPTTTMMMNGGGGGGRMAVDLLVSSDCVTIEEKIINGREKGDPKPKRLTSFIDADERPPPDVVKQTMKIFEANANRRGLAASQRIPTAPVATTVMAPAPGEVATKVASYRSIIIATPAPVPVAVTEKPPITHPKPPLSPKKPNIKPRTASPKHQQQAPAPPIVVVSPQAVTAKPPPTPKSLEAVNNLKNAAIGAGTVLRNGGPAPAPVNQPHPAGTDPPSPLAVTPPSPPARIATREPEPPRKPNSGVVAAAASLLKNGSGGGGGGGGDHHHNDHENGGQNQHTHVVSSSTAPPPPSTLLVRPLSSSPSPSSGGICESPSLQQLTGQLASLHLATSTPTGAPSNGTERNSNGTSPTTATVGDRRNLEYVTSEEDDDDDSGDGDGEGRRTEYTVNPSESSEEDIAVLGGSGSKDVRDGAGYRSQAPLSNSENDADDDEDEEEEEVGGQDRSVRKVSRTAMENIARAGTTTQFRFNGATKSYLPGAGGGTGAGGSSTVSGKAPAPPIPIARESLLNAKPGAAAPANEVTGVSTGSGGARGGGASSNASKSDVAVGGGSVDAATGGSSGGVVRAPEAPLTRREIEKNQINRERSGEPGAATTNNSNNNNGGVHNNSNSGNGKMKMMMMTSGVGASVEKSKAATTEPPRLGGAGSGSGSAVTDNSTSSFVAKWGTANSPAAPAAAQSPQTVATAAVAPAATTTPAIRKKPKPPPSQQQEASNTMVFNFSDRKDVPDYIENDGVIIRPRPRELPKPGESGFVVLGDLTLETSTDPDDAWAMGPPSPCNGEFANAYIVINGKSSMRNKTSRSNKFKIQFDDSLTSTYEYPSETSLLETNGFNDADSGSGPDNFGGAAADSGLLSHTNKLLSSVPLGSAPFASYTPVKAAIDTTFELGVTRTPSPSAASTASSTGSSNGSTSSSRSGSSSNNSSHQQHSATSHSDSHYLQHSLSGATIPYPAAVAATAAATINGNGYGPGPQLLDRPSNNNGGNSLHSNGHHGDAVTSATARLLNGDATTLCGTGEPESIQYLKPASDEQTVNWSQGTRVTDLLF